MALVDHLAMPTLKRNNYKYQNYLILQVDQAEGKTLVSHFNDGATKAMASGILVNKMKYMFIKSDDRLLIGKKGSTGVSIYK